MESRTLGFVSSTGSTSLASTNDIRVARTSSKVASFCRNPSKARIAQPNTSTSFVGSKSRSCTTTVKMADSSSSQKKRVVVTGAAGKTGKLVMDKLLKKKDQFEVIGVVRDASSQKKLAAELKVSTDVIKVADIQDPNALQKAMSPRVDGLVIVTSAIPKIKWWSLIKVIIYKILGKKASPEFTFKLGQNPRMVDYVGQKNQIDAARANGCKQVVIVSSMGGTDKTNFLNTMGNGNILMWKRKAEKYLVSASDLMYTIIHPGGLLDKQGGLRELVFGLNDEIIKGGDSSIRTIPRDDVARVCIEALEKPEVFGNKSFDLTSKPEGNGNPNAPIVELFGQLQGKTNAYNYPIDTEIDAMN
eukprot:CAMPEP_0184691892 /NCGR_PEP_ID=MMETSP0313-20130426/597_1 /TAXON_ID=2792 /ORGANISM="Porphyridium aerugineum, Strain SAG 1380-2" /LENGTH=358 /DNA_ID=CAMNT_0027149671 /DNA_START=30 /DNA_END=1106 /DNA_ORIENTATION=+